MNLTNSKINQRLISEVSPEKYLGYFPLANILNSLDVEEHFKYMQSNRNFQFNVFDIFSSLVYARAVAPLSKYRTFHNVLAVFIPIITLYLGFDLSYTNEKPKYLFKIKALISIFKSVIYFTIITYLLKNKLNLE